MILTVKHTVELVHANGTAVETKHNTIMQLCLFVKHLCTSLFHRTVGKVTLVWNQQAIVEQIRTSECSSSECSGVLEMTDADIVCKIPIAQGQ